MNSLIGFSRNPTLSEEFRFLCMLHNIGATASEKSLSIEEISGWTMIEASAIRFHLQRLIELEYVQSIQFEGTEKYHLTPNGIRKVLTLYS